MEEKIFNIDNTEYISQIFGNFDANIKKLEKTYDVKIVNRGCEVKITGNTENVQKTEKVISSLILLLEKGENITQQNLNYLVDVCNEGQDTIAKAKEVTNSDCICITTSGKPVKPKTVGQKKYIDSIKDNTIVFGIGPAGTGKTYLAVAMAVKAFKAQEINRIILTRPAVEAGESLGFLPGDLQTKVDPYLRPLYDALFEMLGEESFQKHLEKGTIEVAPLAYMRGRSLNDSFIILDEAQNTTREQMKMFLTRLGFNSKAVVTGDITQIDLPSTKKSGLIEATRILKGVEDIDIIKFSEKDVVRSKIVQDIIKAYDKYNDKKRKFNEIKK